MSNPYREEDLASRIAALEEQVRAVKNGAVFGRITTWLGANIGKVIGSIAAGALGYGFGGIFAGCEQNGPKPTAGNPPWDHLAVNYHIFDAFHPNLLVLALGVAGVCFAIARYND